MSETPCQSFSGLSTRRVRTQDANLIPGKSFGNCLSGLRKPICFFSVLALAGDLIG